MENKLKFNNGSFRIMIVGDPHVKSKFNTQKDINKIKDYMRFQYEAVKRISPDLIVLMGDNVSGENAEQIRSSLIKITLPYLDAGIPFAFVLGNHDLQGNIKDIKEYYDIYRTVPGCLLPEEENVNEFGDYCLTVKSSDNTENAFNMWFIYSGDKADRKYYSEYDFVKTKQIEWYKDTAKKLAHGNNVLPAVLFQHIPVPEVFRLLNRKSFFSLLTDGIEGLNFKRNEYYDLNKKIGTEGYMGEVPCSPEYNNGEFEAWKETGDIAAAFFGHDHMNDFIGMVDGIVLAQNKTASFNVYGDGLMQGVRVLDINEKNPRDIKTEMIYYRDFFGDDCLSITGTEKKLRDRTAVKLDAIKKYAPVAAAVITPAILRIILRKK